MAVVTGAALAAGVAVTLAVPVFALHELIVKRHKSNMKRHFPQLEKKVSFPCKSAEPVVVGYARKCKKTTATAKINNNKETVKEVPTIPLPLPPYKSVLKRPITPPPTYDEVATGLPAVAPRPRMNVRFAERA